MKLILEVIFIANPVLIAKALVMALSNDKLRRGMGWTIAAILSPIIVILALLIGIMSATADHNTTAIDLCFNSGVISGNVPEEFIDYIEDMQYSFSLLDYDINKINNQTENGNSLDSLRVKAVFYALYFGADRPSLVNTLQFSDCFVTYEERSRTVTDEEGNESEETYTVAVPIIDLSIVYRNIENMMEITVTSENQMNANRIYALVKYGHGAIGVDELPYPGEPIGDGSYKELIEEAEKYLGYPYVWGGSNPRTSFDCSGYVCWVYTQSGVYNLPRTTATGIYNQCALVPKTEAMPGDLVFFKGTYAGAGIASHIGIYVGNGKMLHAGDPIGYANINTKYWQKHFLGFGRLPDTN
ncbi:C40 family peptidase [Anaerotignum propionicum]|uniref:C40 family peptidase n=1 Tax=Anaerotignum propionicum TaxID=28446 RepID=UPI000BBA1125|nr:C40 family peptidase [Anaerotignum propionicum]